MSNKPTLPHSYLKITDIMDGVEKHLYFISEENFTEEDITSFMDYFTGDWGILDTYMVVFPDRKCSVSVGKYYTPITATENSVVYNVKNKERLVESFMTFGELAGKGVFEDCDIYKERGLLAFYENYEIKEKMYDLYAKLEGRDYEDEDEFDMDEIDRWTNQSYVF